MQTEPSDKPGRVPHSARHTLGSDPEAAGTPPRGTSEPSERQPSPSPAELARPVWWVAAQERTRASNDNSEAAKIAQRAVAQVDRMWSFVDQVEQVARSAGPQEKPSLTHFREFLNRDLAGLFADLARHVSSALASERGWGIAQFDECAERFGRYVDVARLAASDAHVPSAASAVLHRANLALSDALPDLAALVGALVVAAGGEPENGSRHS